MTTLYEYAELIQGVMVDGMDQFESILDEGNFGVGFLGWHNALMYSRENDLGVWGAVLFPGGAASEPERFGGGRFQWNFMIFMFQKWETESATDQSYADLADDALSALMAGRLTICDKGTFKIVDMMPMDSTTVIENIQYIPVVILASVIKEYS